jgi:hypothetical protein
MKKQKVVCYGMCFLAFCCVCGFVSCATVSSEPPPEWAASFNGVQNVYPRNAYLAQKGEGGTRREAETAGIVELSRYFTNEIRTSESRRRQSTDQNGASSVSLRRDTETLVKSETNLIAVRFSQAYHKNKNEWEVVAYIDRGEAWAIYRPRIERAAGAFRALYGAAENEKESLKKYFAYKTAAAYAEGDEFDTITLFAQTLNPEKTESSYGDVYTAIEKLPQKLNAARQSATIYINCPVDLDGMIAAAFSKNLSAEGFPVTTNRSAAEAVCDVSVDEGLQKMDTGNFYFPAARAVLSGKTGALWTFNVKTERQGAVTPDVAKRRAYTALVQEIQKMFSTEFDANFKK